eukprot:jgi/Bigna1/71300/fgenesh1_pg.15_\
MTAGDQNNDDRGLHYPAKRNHNCYISVKCIDRVGKFVVRANQPDALIKHGEGGKWRIGSFEVVREDTGEKLYSKLDTGKHLVTDEEAFGRWLNEILSKHVPEDGDE